VWYGIDPSSEEKKKYYPYVIDKLNHAINFLHVVPLEVVV